MPATANPSSHIEKWSGATRHRRGSNGLLTPFLLEPPDSKAPFFGLCLNPSDQQRRSKRASTRSRQQRRSGPEGAEEEDAARGHFPRNEASRPLRKTIGKEGAGKGGSDPPGPQARAQEDAARGTAADEAPSGSRRRSWRRRSGRPRYCFSGLFIS